MATSPLLIKIIQYEGQALARKQHLHFFRDTYHGFYRIWATWWPGDAFDTPLIAEVEGEVLAYMIASKKYVEGLPENDDGTLWCEACQFLQTVNTMPKGKRGRPRLHVVS